MTNADMLAWIHAHPLESWGAASAVITLLLRARSAAKWVALIESYRAGAIVLAPFRYLGVDVAGLILFIARVVSAKAAGQAMLGLLPTADVAPPTPRNDGQGGST